MNRQELNKILGLIRDSESIRELLIEANNYSYISIKRKDNDRQDITINSDLIIPVLVTRQSEIKSELKKLGYEE